MGTISKGILGGVSGKVGSVVGANWKGIDYLRIKPSAVANPSTDLQTAQRLKFSVMLKFLQPLNELIRIGFKAYAIKMSSFNAAFSYNYREALTGTFPSYSLDYSKAMLSRGNLPGALNAACSSTESGKVKITWKSNAGSSMALPTDTAMVAIFDPDNKQAVCMLNAGERSAEMVEIDVPDDFSGKSVHCFISFMSIGAAFSGQVKNSISSSVYAGNVIVA